MINSCDLEGKRGGDEGGFVSRITMGLQGLQKTVK